MQKPDAPTFDAWYKDTWPEWGGGHISARKREALKKTPDYFQLPDGKWLHYKGSGDKADQKNWEPAEAPKPDEPPMDTRRLPARRRRRIEIMTNEIEVIRPRKRRI